MKIKIKVTKEILSKSMMCGVAESRGLTKEKNTAVGNCAIALAVRDVFPNATVYPPGMLLFGRRDPIDTIEDSKEIQARPDWVANSYMTEAYIRRFDEGLIYPQSRLRLSEYEFSIEVPETVIDSVNIEALEQCETMELVSD